MRSEQRTLGGYSLVELLLVVALIALVVSQTMLAFTSQHKTYMVQERVVDAQHDARLLADSIVRDLRMAGFMVPRDVGIGSIDGGTGAPDMLCMSDSGAFVESSFEDATDRFDAPSLTAAVSTGDTSVTMSASSMDIDGDATNDFVVGEGILISDGTNAHCGLITGVSSGAVQFVPGSAAGATLPALSASAVPAVVYQISGTTLTRNSVPLSNEVDDFQVEFWVDADGDGLQDGGEFPVHDLNGSDLTEVRMARVHITTHTASGDVDFTGQRPASANRAGAGSTDNLRRRKVTADVRLRNLR